MGPHLQWPFLRRMERAGASVEAHLPWQAKKKKHAWAEVQSGTSMWASGFVSRYTCAMTRVDRRRDRWVRENNTLFELVDILCFVADMRI